MRTEPNAETYNERLTAAYDDLNYGRSLSAFFMRRGHRLLESPFGPDRHFSTVLEVGSGAGEHLPYVRHSFDTYHQTDWSPSRLERARAAMSPELRDKVRVASEDATKLSFASSSVDRLIASHILEHLPAPHEVLREWYRVVRPGGVMSVLVPCDPGLLWRLGRRLGPRSSAERAGIEYDYWMAREHVNPIHNLVVFARYYFPDREESWYPTGIPSTDINLFYVWHVRKR
jgi:phosphatidylethanolamine/phosphatidyl-N-methylethanolamine N-methyltransferase